MNNYYYLIASLPSLDTRPSQKNSDYEDIIYFINDSLSDSDRQLFKCLLYPVDIKNIINHIADGRNLPEVYPYVLQPGTLNTKDLDGFLKGKIDTYGFLKGFYEDYHEQLNGLALVEIEKMLIERFYQSVFQQGDKFLISYFTFDRDLKNIIIISNSRKFDFDPRKYLEGEFLPNHKFDITGEYSFVDEISNVPKDDSPANLEKVLDKIRWKFIDQLSAFSFFDLHAVFAWFLKYQIHLRWIGEWTEEDAKQKINVFSDHAMEEFKMPELFINLKKRTL